MITGLYILGPSIASPATEGNELAQKYSKQLALTVPILVKIFNSWCSLCIQ